MNREEPRREEDSQRFEEITREVREEQSPSTGDEGTEADRRQWEKTRNISKEASEIPEEANEQRRPVREDPPGG
jgi:hypothetical protein